jgi:hypothetical protein
MWNVANAVCKEMFEAVLADFAKCILTDQSVNLYDDDWSQQSRSWARRTGGHAFAFSQ